MAKNESMHQSLVTPPLIYLKKLELHYLWDEGSKFEDLLYQLVETRASLSLNIYIKQHIKDNHMPMDLPGNELFF